MAERPSPITAELNAVIEAAAADWRAWVDRLIQDVAKLVTNGGRDVLRRLDDGVRQKLEALFQQHAAEIQTRLTGMAIDPTALAAAIRQQPQLGRMAGPGGQSRGAIAYRLGRHYGKRETPVVRDVEVSPGKLADAQKLADKESVSRLADEIEYIQRRGAVNMRRPVMGVIQEIDRVLTDAEYATIRQSLARGREEAMNYKRLSRELKDAVQGKPTLINDMDRVARTETMFAAHDGALSSLREQAARVGLGEDPEVYKFASPGACTSCRRIWGPIGNPRRYRLSEVMAGDNYGKSEKDWGPTIGPTHPNCTCPPIMLYMPDVMDATQRALQSLEKKYGR